MIESCFSNFSPGSFRKSRQFHEIFFLSSSTFSKNDCNFCLQLQNDSESWESLKMFLLHIFKKCQASKLLFCGDFIIWIILKINNFVAELVMAWIYHMFGSSNFLKQQCSISLFALTCGIWFMYSKIILKLFLLTLSHE